MAKYSTCIYLILLSALFMGCGVDTFQCDDCEDPFTPDNCVDKHAQFHQAVIYTLNTAEVEFIELDAIDPFTEGFVSAVDLYRITETSVLISSYNGNYIFDTISNEVSKIEEAEIPIVGYADSKNLYFSVEAVGDIVINDSTIIKQFINSSTLYKSPISTSKSDIVVTYQSRFIHPDTLLIPKLFFPVEVPHLDGFIALAEDEVHFVSVSSTTNRIRTVFEYKERAWKHFDDQGNALTTLTTPRRSMSMSDPSHVSLSIDPFLISHEEEMTVVLSNIQDGTQSVVEGLAAPQLSNDAAHFSALDGNQIHIYSIGKGERITVSEFNDVTTNNPTQFSNQGNTLLIAEQFEENSSINDAVLKRASFEFGGQVSIGNVFELSSQSESDSLDFLLSRASQPVFLNDREILFLVFQHQLNSCNRFF